MKIQQPGFMSSAGWRREKWITGSREDQGGAVSVEEETD